MKALAIVAAALALALLPRPGVGPATEARAASFDCAKATLPTDKAICRDSALSGLDSQIGVAYSRRLAADPGVQPLQRAWLRDREAACGRDDQCLRQFMVYQLSFLLSGRPMSGSLPAIVGVCSVTRASRVGSRLEGDPQSGSAIQEANGAVQEFYDVIPGVSRTRVGDAMLVCLASLPQNCPPGDDRGKIYAAANLRTLDWWTGPDAEHSCGGA